MRRDDQLRTLIRDAMRELLDVYAKCIGHPLNPSPKRRYWDLGYHISSADYDYLLRTLDDVRENTHSREQHDRLTGLLIKLRERPFRDAECNSAFWGLSSIYDYVPAAPVQKPKAD